MSLLPTLKLKKISVVTFVIMMTSAITLAGGVEWKPVTPEELAMKTPTIEPEADAEALFWDVYVADEADGGSPRTVLRHYLRIKIFTEKGRDDNSKVDIPFGKISGFGSGIKIKDIAARTIKPDGSIVVLDQKDIFERDVVKASGVKLRAKSFALPGIQPGSIIEYRWTEIRGDSLSLYDRLEFARDIPVHNITYHLKPISLPGFPYGMRAQTFNAVNSPFKKEKDGYYATGMSNVPSYREETKMPPEYSVRPWMLVYYAEDTSLTPEKYWLQYGKDLYESHKSQMKVNDEIRQATTEAVGDATDPLKKIENIFNYVRVKVKNIYDDASGMTSEQIKATKENKNAADALKRGTGDWHDMNMLFAAMVTAAGLDARVAKLSRRSDVAFSRTFTDDYFMRTENVAVKVGEEWKYFDPGSRYATFGMLRWEEEGQPALISDPKVASWQLTPFSPPAKSMEARSGRFKLTEDGTLVGEAKVTFTGHLAAYQKEYNDDDNPSERENTLRYWVQSHILGSADISNFSIENVSDPDKPFTYAFTLVVPGYATRTGKRMFFQPNVFERGSQTMFSTNARRYDIFMNYGWAENDDITIDLPNGYSLESPDAPADLTDAQGISSSKIKIAVTQDGKTVYYKRDFSFGNGGYLSFPRTAYPALKALFEAFYKLETHQLTLRQGPPTATPATKPS